VKWNLRLAAAHRGIWTASELQRLLADRGLVISAGKMSGLWSGQPQSIKLSDLDVICAVLDATPDELLIPEQVAEQPTQPQDRQQAAGAGAPTVRPRPKGGRSLPPAP